MKLLCHWWSFLLVLVQVSSDAANCSSHEQCLETLAHVTSIRQKKEAEALELVGRAKVAFQKATHSEEQSKISLDRAEQAEEEQAKWQKRETELKAELRSLDDKLEASNTAQQEAEAAAKRAVAAKLGAIEYRKHEAAISTMPAQERCLADFASCTAGLVTLQVQQWMALLHIFNRFLVALVSIALGALLLLLPAEGQALSFATTTLIVIPVLLAGAFKDFLRLVGSPPAVLVILAGILTMGIAVVFLWQGAAGLRLLLGAGLAVLLGDLVLVIIHDFIPIPAILVALFALALGLLGGAAGLYRQIATQAFAMAVPGALLVAAGAVLIFSVALSPEAYLEDVASALAPWAHHGNKVLGNFFCECGRLLWLVLLLPALVRLLMAAPDVPHVLPRKSSVTEAEEAPVEKQEHEDVRSARDVENPAVTEEAQNAQAASEDELDPVAATQLLQRTVEALQALENTLPPSTALAEAMPPQTHLAQNLPQESGSRSNPSVR